MQRCATTIIRSASVEELRPDIGPLLQAHWEEVAKNKHLMRLNPAWDTYRDLERAGALFVLGAWADTTLVGYSATFLNRHIHYSDLIYAQNDVLFVVPEHRGCGGRLMVATEREAKERGAQIMLWHAKPDSVLDRKLDQSVRYSVQDILYSREL